MLILWSAGGSAINDNRSAASVKTADAIRRQNTFAGVASPDKRKMSRLDESASETVSRAHMCSNNRIDRRRQLEYKKSLL